MAADMNELFPAAPYRRDLAPPEFRPNGKVYQPIKQLRVFGTGHEMPVASIYRGTTIAPDGYYVWHLVERVDEELYAATTSSSSVSEPMPAELEETP